VLNYMQWTHVLGSVCSADEGIGVKTLTADSETFDLKSDHKLHTVQLALRALALRVILLLHRSIASGTNKEYLTAVFKY